MAKLLFSEVKDNWWYRLLQVLSICWVIIITAGAIANYYDAQESKIRAENRPVELHSPRTKYENTAKLAVENGVDKNTFKELLTQDAERQDLSDNVAESSIQQILDYYDSYTNERLREMSYKNNSIVDASARMNAAPLIAIIGIGVWYLFRLIFLYILTGKLVWWGIKGEVNVEAELEKLEHEKRRARLKQMLADNK